MNFEIDAGIASLTFNRPRQLNALDVATAEALLIAAKRIHADPSIRVVVFKGVGRAFMAGGDLAYFYAAENRAEAARKLIAPMHEALSLLRRTPAPMIAALKGPVAGAGMSLALLADFAIAASDTLMSMSYIKLGASPDCGASWTLPRLVGHRRATEIMLLSDPIGASDALRLGLINRVVDCDQLEEAAAELAKRLASLSSHALAATRALLDPAEADAFDIQLERELAAFVACAATPEFDQALANFFKEPTSSK